MNITERIALTAKLDAEYAASLEGPRPESRGGSYTTRPITDYADGLFQPIADQSLAGPGTQILQGVCPGIGGVERILSLETALEEGYDVRFRKGAHGWEAYCHGNLIAPGRRNDLVTLIVATEENKDGLEPGALITWYPGNPTASLDFRVGVKPK